MMHYGAILEKGEECFTYLDKVFAALENIQENYNWLLTDGECNVDIPELEDEFYWMSGSELTALQRKYHNPQWIWAVLSAFEKSVTKEHQHIVLGSELGVETAALAVRVEPDRPAPAGDL